MKLLLGEKEDDEEEDEIKFADNAEMRILAFVLIEVEPDLNDKGSNIVLSLLTDDELLSSLSSKEGTASIIASLSSLMIFMELIFERELLLLLEDIFCFLVLVA